MTQFKAFIRSLDVKRALMALLLPTLLAATTANAYVPYMFLKIPGVPGDWEYPRGGEAGWLTVTGFSWGGSGGGRSACINDITFYKDTDSSSTSLAMSMVTGTVYPEIKFEVVTNVTTPVFDAAPSIEFFIRGASVSAFTVEDTGAYSYLARRDVLSVRFDELHFVYTGVNDDGTEKVTSGTIYPERGC